MFFLILVGPITLLCAKRFGKLITGYEALLNRSDAPNSNDRWQSHSHHGRYTGGAHDKKDGGYQFAQRAPSGVLDLLQSIVNSGALPIYTAQEQQSRDSLGYLIYRMPYNHHELLKRFCAKILNQMWKQASINSFSQLSEMRQNEDFMTDWGSASSYWSNLRRSKVLLFLLIWYRNCFKRW